MQFVDVNPHEDIRQLVRQFGEKEIRPVLEKYEKEEELPMDQIGRAHV